MPSRSPPRRREAPCPGSGRREAPRAAPTRRELLAAGLAVLPAWARGQTAYPSRAITLVVPFAPGGIADLTARAVAKEMAGTLGQPVVVDNRPSAGSIVGAAAVAQAAPDGHTVLLLSNANAVSATLFRKLPYDVQRDFAPVGLLARFDLVLLVNAAAPLRDLPALLERARARPGALTIGTIAAGSTQHLAAELFRSVAGIDALVVPYKGTPGVLTALRAGEIDVAFEILGPTLAQVKAGVLRALAVTGARRFDGLPAVPTVHEAAGLDYDVASWNALAVPAGTPPAVIARLGQAAEAALAAPAVRRQLGELGVRPQGGTPAQLAELLAAEIRRWGAVVKAAKIELQ